MASAALPSTVAPTTSSQRKRHTLSAHLPAAPFELLANGETYMVNPSCRLGAGMWAQVVGGIHAPTDTPIAVKLIAKASLLEKDVKLLNSERKVYETTKHPNLIECKASLEDDAYYYFVLEYRGGGDMFSFVKRAGRLPSNPARIYFKQILEGVQYLHKMGICHRDIKLENILLDESYSSVVVADFGLSASTSSLLTTFCGSPCYAAPELVKRVPYDGTISDIWALGVVLFTMTAGRFPYYDEAVAVVLKKITNDPLHFSSAHASPLRELLAAILCKEPEKRISLDDVVKHAWMQPPQERSPCLPRRRSFTNTLNRTAA